MGIEVPGVPERFGQRVVGLDLRGNFSDVTVFDSELILSSAILRVMRLDLLVAERLQLCKCLLEGYCHSCNAPAAKATFGFSASVEKSIASYVSCP